MTKSQEDALIKLRIRVARMTRLLALDAPIIIIAGEADLIARAGQELDPAGHGERERRRIVDSCKVRLGICREDDCDEHVAGDESRTGGDYYCVEHAQQINEQDVFEDAEPGEVLS